MPYSQLRRNGWFPVFTTLALHAQKVAEKSAFLMSVTVEYLEDSVQLQIRTYKRSDLTVLKLHSQLPLRVK